MPFMKTREKYTHAFASIYKEENERIDAGQTHEKVVTVTVSGEEYWVAGGKR